MAEKYYLVRKELEKERVRLIKTYVKNKLSEVYNKTEVNGLLNGKQNILSFDEAPTDNSDNPVKSKGIKAYTYSKSEIDSKIAAVLATIKNAEEHGY